MDRPSAYALVCEYTHSESLRRHMLAVESAMRAYGRKFGEDEEKWGIVGLLHDFDYERWPNPPDHPLQGAAILTEKGYPADVIYAIKSHVDLTPLPNVDVTLRVTNPLAEREEYNCPRVSLMDKALFACDELAGFCIAVAKIRPEGIRGMEAKSVRKKLKQASFAAAVSRDDIARGGRPGR